MKIYNKKYNLTLSIVNDNLVVGLFDTVDPITHHPLFDCKCISHLCEGYEISNKSLDIIYQEYSCDNSKNQLSLIKIEYYIKRLQQQKIDIENKIEDSKKNLHIEIPKKKRINTCRNDDSNLNIQNENENLTVNYDENQNFNISRNTLVIKKDPSKQNILKLVNKAKIENGQKKFNTIDKIIQKRCSRIISNNINEYNKKNAYSIQTDENEKSNKKIPIFGQIRKEIKNKEKLLQLVREKSHRYLENQKIEMRKGYMAKKRKENNVTYNISNIFNKKNNKDLSHGASNDIVLDSILYNVNKNGKYDRILGSYITPVEYKDNINKKIIVQNSDNISTIKKQKKFKCNLSVDIKKKIDKNNDVINNLNPKLNMVYPQILITNNGKLKKNEEDENNSYSLPNIDTYDNKKVGRNYKPYNLSVKKNKSENIQLIKSFKMESAQTDNNNNKKNLIQSVNIDNNLCLISVYDNKKVSFVDPLAVNKFNEYYELKKYKNL